MRRWTAFAVLLVIVATAALFGRVIVAARDFDTVVAADRFDAIRNDNTALRSFLQRMPKGGDLHVHLSGSVYAERLIEWAVKDGLCVRLADFSIVEPPCDKDKRIEPIADALRNQALYDRLVNALSMRFFAPSGQTRSGHDQFFATFSRFGVASARHAVDMTVDQLRHYQADNVQYAEFMMTFLPSRIRDRLAAALGNETDLTAMFDAAQKSGLDQVVEDMRAQVDDQVQRVEAALGCDAARTKPGCKVRYNYIAQIGRNGSIQEVFVQTAAAAALLRVAPRVVGLNFVQPEDHQVARRDYSTHMEFVAFLAKKGTIALHAGELWLGLVPPEDLVFHITGAVMTAGASRIGHGTALAFELGMEGLLAAMKRRDVVVEISLTSSDLILGVRGKDHPLPTYLAAGVPVVLATDDAGVARITLSSEYFRAAREHGLGYRTLKTIARNAIVHSFLSPDDKRGELDRFNEASAAFERSLVGPRWRLRNLAALVRAAVRPLH